MKLNGLSKNLKKVSCKNREQALKELTKFISKKCKAGDKHDFHHDFHKVQLTYSCSKCKSTFTVDERIMKEIDIDQLLHLDRALYGKKIR